MYIVKSETGEVVLMCSRLEDAEAYTKTSLDEVKYTVVKV